MATEIGIIKAIIGTATATATDGSVRILQVGDKVYQNDLITTGAAGALEIEFRDGTKMDMGRSSQAVLDMEIFDPNATVTETAETADDVAAIQQALLEGEDPSVIGEATAAGAGATGDGSEGGHSFVFREYLNPEVTPDNGFDTIGVSNEFDNSEELNLILVDEETPDTPEVNLPPTITPDPQTPPPTGGDNEGPQNIISSGLVAEAGLSFGSDPASDSESFNGSFFISDPDGIDDIVNISFNGGAPIAIADLIPGLVIPTDLGEITILNFDDATGEVSFSYELINNVISDPATDDGNNTETGAEIISVVVTDTAGQEGTGNIIININDDVPEANDDIVADDVAEDGSVDINVFANDEAGADGVDLVNGISVESGPSKGTLIYNDDGSFTYTANAGEEGADSFTYTIEDGDGDTSTATVNLIIADDSTPTIATPDLNEDGDVVAESALPDGSGGGTLTTSGMFQINTGNDALDLIEVQDKDGNWVEITADSTTVTGAYGTLTVDLDGSWSYELADNTLDHDGDDLTGADDQVQDLFDVRVSDDDGDTSAPATLTININDDGPVAVDDVATQTTEDTDVVYNVLTNADGTSDEQGADGATLTNATVNTGLGSIAFLANGQVTYTPAEGEEGTVIIDYTITDADGDTSDATLTIDLAGDSTPTIDTPDNNDDGDVVAESALPDGSGGGTLTTSGMFQINTGNDALDLIEVQDKDGNWVEITADGTTVTGAYGTLTVDLDGSWSYELADNTLDHDGDDLTGADDQVQDLFDVRVSDDDGDTSAPATLTININDDGPVAVDDVATQTTEDTDVVYNVLTNADGTSDEQGADGATLTNATVNTGLGSVAFLANGQVTYTPAEGEEGTVIIDYTITDADGDTSDATLTINLADDSTPTIATPDLNEDGDVVAESALPDGSGGGTLTTSGMFQINTGNDALDLIEVQDKDGNWVEITADGTTVTGAYGTLTVDLDGSWSYELADNTLDHDGDDLTGADDQVQDLFDVRVSDNDGDTSAPATLTININDDGPVAVDDVATQTTEDTDVVYNVLTNADGTSDEQGADGATLTNATVNTGLGSVAFLANGQVTYTPAEGEEGTVIIDYTITDADGDTSDATLTIDLAGDSTPTIDTPDNNDDGDVVDESALPDGSGGGTLTTSGMFQINTGNDALDLIEVQDKDGNWVEITADGTTVTGAYGTLTVDLDGSWSYELADNTLDHDGNDLTGADDQVQDLFDVRVSDDDGDTSAPATLTININDDGPLAQVLDDIVAEAQLSPVSLTVDETKEAQLDPVDNAGDRQSTMSFAQLFATVDADASDGGTYGADGPGNVTYSLSLVNTANGESLSDIGSGLYAVDDTDKDLTDGDGYGQGDEILLSVDANGNITGSANGNVYFTISVDEVTGDVTFTQSAEFNIWHGDDGDNNDAESLALAALAEADVAIRLTQEVTDAEGDSATASVDLASSAEGQSVANFTVLDDGPTAIVPSNTSLVNVAAGAITSIPLDIDGDIHDNIGTDLNGTLRFTVEDGEPVVGSYGGDAPEQLSSGGLPIFYYNGGDVLYGSTTEPDAWDAENPTDLVFQVSLNLDPNGSDSYDFQLFSKIDAQLEAFTVTGNDAYDFTGGNTDYIYFDIADSEPTPDILITPLEVDTDNGFTTSLGGSMNANANQTGTNNGPTVQFEAGVRVNYVEGIGGNPGSGNQGYTGPEDHFFTEHETVNGGAATFAMKNNDEASVRLAAYTETSTPDGVGGSNDTVKTGEALVEASYIVINDGTNDYIVSESGAVLGTTYVVTFNPDGTVDVDGVTDGTRISLFTEGEGYNAIEFIHLGGDDFALGGFGASVPGQEEVITFGTFPLELVDADGDAVTIDPGIEITLVPENASAVVSDASLENGIPQDGESNTDSGSFSVAAFAGADLTLDEPVAELTSNGEPVVWALSGDGKTLTGSADGNEVIVITIANNGEYTVTLSDTLDHPVVNQEDQLNFVVNVVATSGGMNVGNLSLTVFVNDDKPEIASFKEETVSAVDTPVLGNIFDTIGDGDILPDAGLGFGADGGYVQTVSIGGMSFNYDGETISVVGSNDAVTGYMSDGNSLTVTTFKGETITVNMDSGDYSYVTNGQLAEVLPTEVAPVVNIKEGGDLLGLVGVEALDLVDFGSQAAIKVTDANNNVESVSVTYDAPLSIALGEGTLLDLIGEVVSELNLLDLLNLTQVTSVVTNAVQAAIDALLPPTNDPISFNQAVAEELGINIEIVDTDWQQVIGLPDIELNLGLLTLYQTISIPLGNIDVSTGTYTLLVTSADGGEIDQFMLNEFLATLQVDEALVDIDVLGSLSVSATDTAGNTDDSADILNLAELNLSDSDTDAGLIIGDDNNEMIAGGTGSERIYGLDGDDNITGGGGNDIIRGGVGNDTIDGGAGRDILIGGQGNDTLTGSSSNNVFRWEQGNAGTVDTPAIDTVTDFSIAALASGGDVLDLGNLLQGEARVGDLSLNLTEFMAFSYDEGTGHTTLSISSDGSGDVDQTIVFEGVNFFTLGDTDLAIINSLLESGQLIVDEAQAGQTYQGGYTDVDFVVIDNDGDTESTSVRFDHDGIEFEGEGNVAPEVDVSGDGLLGLLGVSALGAIDFGTNQTFKAFDRDNNITRVEINFGALVTALGGFELTFSAEAAAAFGLQVTDSEGSAISLLGNTVSLLDFSDLVITAEDGGTIDNFTLNAFLATVEIRDENADLLNLDVSADVLDAVTITATDAFGLTDSETLATLVEAEALDDSQIGAAINVVAEVDAGIISADAELEASLVLGGDNADTLIGSEFDDVLFGGEGDDTLIGGQGNDILIGGEDADIFKWNAGDDGTTESPAVDVVIDFNAIDGDVLDVSDLLNDPNASENLDDYLVASYDSENDQTTIEVYTEGNAQSGSAQSTQSIIVNGDQSNLNQLLDSGNLNVDNS